PLHQEAERLERGGGPARKLDAAAAGALGEGRERVGAPADRLPHGGRGALADAREELERPLPGQLVFRVAGDSQEREDVLDVPLLEEARPGADLVRDAAARQLDLD